MTEKWAKYCVHLSKIIQINLSSIYLAQLFKNKKVGASWKKSFWN